MNSFKNELSNAQANLLSTINSGVNILFWEIGKIINNSHRLGEITGENFIKELSNILSPVFGEYLNTINLSLMRKLNKKCSAETISFISEALNWEYIKQLLILEDQDAWLFYLKLTHIESLTPLELKKEILTKIIDNNRIKDESGFTRTGFKLFYRKTSELYFEKKNSGAFRNLFEPRDHKVFISFLSKQSNNEAIMDIYRLLIEFQSETHYILNLQFNHFLWQTGGSIIRLSKRENVPITDCINKCIQEFGNHFSSVFNELDLSFCVNFSEKYERLSGKTEIAELLSWPYIKVLLDVNETEKHTFLAKQIFNSGFTVEKIKSLISMDYFDVNNVNRVFDMSTNSNKTTAETKKGNNTFVVTEELIVPIVHPIHDLNRNIYKNNELLDFLTSNKYIS